MSTVTSSPSRSQRGGVLAIPTPGGVPVAITSPGSRLIVRVTNAISSATPKIICAVDESCTVSPPTSHRIRSVCGSGISSVVTSHGPMGRNPSIALPSSHWEDRNCRSRAETSLTHVYPATCSRAVRSFTR